MKYLIKKPDSEILCQELSYQKQSNRTKIRQILKAEQVGFCAYSERFIHETDAVDIEHFDPRLKNTEADNYHNWFAVLSKINGYKPRKIEPFLPIATPNSEVLKQKLQYEDGIYKSVNENDTEINNLIKLLKLNKHEIYIDRQNHVERIKILKSLCNDEEEFLEQLKFKENLSFATALEVELDLELDTLIFDL